MNTQTLKTLSKTLSERFADYVDRFRTDGTLHPMHQLKLEHSIRVSADARAIAEGMSWPTEEVNLAEVVGLLHDTARFPQFEKYKTFSDADSVDHGDLGFQTLEKESLLDGLADEPRGGRADCARRKTSASYPRRRPARHLFYLLARHPHGTYS